MDLTGRGEPAHRGPEPAGMATIDLASFEVLTFDCYGTLIDWEAGIVAGLRAILDPLGVDAAEDDLLERYARAEAEVEAGAYVRYREVLARSADAVLRGLGGTPRAAGLAPFGVSVSD
jgi:FMN phosphatase YigB (HAD superfamily)